MALSKITKTGLLVPRSNFRKGQRRCHLCHAHGFIASWNRFEYEQWINSSAMPVPVLSWPWTSIRQMAASDTNWGLNQDRTDERVIDCAACAACAACGNANCTLLQLLVMV